MFKRLISLIFASSLAFAQAPIVTVPTRAGQSTSLTVAQADSIGTTLQHQVNASQRTWGYNEIVSSGLVFAYYGGSAWNGTTYVNVADGNVTLSPSTTNYIQRTLAGVVSANTTGWTANQMPMYQVTTSASAMTAIVDQRIQAGSSSTSIAFLQAGVGATASTVDAKLKQFAISVKDFGAIGSPTNDTAAFQAAINAAVSGNASLLIPPGSYTFTSTLTCSGPITIFAYGATITETTAGQGGIAFTGSGSAAIYGGTWNGPQYTTSTVAEQCFSFTGSSAASPFNGVTVRDANIATWGYRAITGTYANSVFINNCSINNIYYAGVQFLSAIGARVENCSINNIVGTPNAYGVSFTRNQVDSLTTDPQSSDWMVRNCLVQNVTNWEGLDTHGGIRGSFIGNHIYNCNQAIGVVKAPGTTTAYAPLEINVIGNHCDSGVTTGTAGTGISFNGADGTVGTPVQLATGNIIGNYVARYGTSSSQTSSAIYLHDTRSLVVQGNNIIEPSPTAVQAYHDNYGLMLSGNTITDAWTSTVAGWSNGWGIYSNSFYNTGTIANNEIVRGSKSATYINTIGIDVSNSSNSSWTYLPGANAAALTIYDPSNIASSALRNASHAGTSTFTGTVNVTGATITGLGAASSTFTQAGTGAVASTVDAKLKQTVSVFDFGAKGDGVTDDTSAIQAALTATANGGTVLFPYTTSNTYLVSAALKFYSGQTIKGAGGVGLTTGGTIIRLTASSTSVIEPNTPATTTVGFGAEGIYFDAQGNAPCAVKFYNTSHSFLKDIGANCTTASGAAILLDANVSLQTYFNTLQDCRAYGTGTGGAGIRFQNGANVNTVIGGRCGSGNYYGMDFLSSSSGNNVFGVDIEGPSTAAVHIDAGANNFHGLHIESTPIGFSITANGSNTGIINPTMASTVTTPISDASALGNRIYSTPDSNSTSYMRVGSFNFNSNYLSGGSNWQFDPTLQSGTANNLIQWLRNTTTTGTKQFTIYNGDGSANYGFLYSPNTGLLSCTAFGTANQVIAATGDFRMRSTGTIKYRNNANNADLVAFTTNSSDQGLFGDINNTNVARNKWFFTAQTALNAGGLNIPVGVAATTPVAGDLYNDANGTLQFKGNFQASGYTAQPVGGAVASAATITPTGPVFHVTGTAAISTINLPYATFTGSITLIPDGLWTTGTGGNIALGSSAVVSRVMTMTYDGTKWYPSY